MANILILGGGFAGLIAAEQLSSALGSEHQITLVSQKEKFIFYPALVQVAFNAFEPEDISFDLRQKLSDVRVRFIQGEVLRINAQKRSVSIIGDDVNGDIRYDYLVIALGRRLATEKVPGFFEYAHHILSTDAAQKFGEAIRNFRGGNIVVGMCPGARLPVPVCESAFALARRFEDDISERKTSITVVFPETVREAFGGAQVYGELEQTFAKHDIRLIENFPVKEASADNISTDGGQTINHDLLMLVPPFQGQVMIKNLGIADEAGFAKVHGSMQVAGLEKTYAAGDCVAFSGPKLAQMAVRQAAVAAKNLAAEIRGEQPEHEYYHEIAAIINQGGEDSIYLHYGIWDDELFRLQKGTLWSWAKSIHDRYWQTMHS